MKILVDNVLGKMPLPGFLAALFGSVVAHPFLFLVAVVLSGLLVTVIQNASTVLNNYVNTNLHQSIILDFRTALFGHTQRMSMTYHDRKRAGLMIYVINAQGDSVARLIMTVPQMGQSVLTLVGMFWISFHLDP